MSGASGPLMTLATRTFLDARASKQVRVAAVISGPDAPDIAYPACVIQSSRKQEAAAAFLSFLQTADAARVFERYGFKPIVAGQ